MFANVVKDPFKKCIVGCSEKFLFMLPCIKVAFQSGLFPGFPLLQDTTPGFHSLDGNCGYTGREGKNFSMKKKENNALQSRLKKDELFSSHWVIVIQ